MVNRVAQIIAGIFLVFFALAIAFWGFMVVTLGGGWGSLILFLIPVMLASWAAYRLFRQKKH